MARQIAVSKDGERTYLTNQGQAIKVKTLCQMEVWHGLTLRKSFRADNMLPILGPSHVSLNELKHRCNG